MFEIPIFQIAGKRNPTNKKNVLIEFCKSSIIIFQTLMNVLLATMAASKHARTLVEDSPAPAKMDYVLRLMARIVKVKKDSKYTYDNRGQIYMYCNIIINGSIFYIN